MKSILYVAHCRLPSQLLGIPAEKLEANQRKRISLAALARLELSSIPAISKDCHYPRHGIVYNAIAARSGSAERRCPECSHGPEIYETSERPWCCNCQR